MSDLGIGLRAGVLALSVIVLAALALFLTDEKKCSVNNDCTIIKRGCSMCGTGGYDSVSEIGAIKISLTGMFRTNEYSCPLVRCAPTNPMTIERKAFCGNNKCSLEQKEFIRCSDLCFNGANYAKIFNKTEDELLKECNCAEVPFIINGCEEADERCFHNVVVVGTVKNAKLLDYPFEEITLDVDRSFNSKPEKIITFKAGKTLFRGGEKVKAFINDANYAGIPEMLSSVEYANLLNAKYYEYLPVEYFRGR